MSTLRSITKAHTNTSSSLKTRMKALGRFMYGNWHGTVVTFVIVSAVLCGLQFINYRMGDFVPWPKNWHYALMFLSVGNIGVAMVVSIIRRRWGRMAWQLALVAVAFACHAVVCFISYCIPTRSNTAPSRKWTISAICLPTSIAFDSLTFLGGISKREPVYVFRVADIPTDQSHFRPGSPLANMIGVAAIDSYRDIMKFCRIEAALPDNAVLSHCCAEYGNIALIVANGVVTSFMRGCEPGIS